MSSVKITVITVCYNAAQTLERTIKSVLDQNYDNKEYIIIDGASKDGTIEILHRYADQLSYWVSEKDHGIYDAMNKGLKQATGDFIILVNADDYLEPGAMERVAAEAGRHPEIGIFHGWLRMQHAHYTTCLKAHDNIHKVTAYIPVHHPTCFVKRSVYDMVGLFDTQYRLTADYDFILRCIEHNVQFYQIPVVLSNMSDGGASAVFATKSEGMSIALKHHVPRLQVYSFRSLRWLKIKLRSLLPDFAMLLYKKLRHGNNFHREKCTCKK